MTGFLLDFLQHEVSFSNFGIYMSLVWRPAMSTGLAWQDEQHKEIFKRIDQLLDAMQQNQGSAVVKELLDFLQIYASQHFSDEENYMLTHSCTTCVKHKQCHEEFKEHLAELVAIYDSQGASTIVVLKLQSWLREWLFSHIMNVDKLMVATSTPDAPGVTSAFQPSGSITAAT